MYNNYLMMSHIQITVVVCSFGFFLTINVNLIKFEKGIIPETKPKMRKRYSKWLMNKIREIRKTTWKDYVMYVVCTYMCVWVVSVSRILYNVDKFDEGDHWIFWIRVVVAIVMISLWLCVAMMMIKWWRWWCLMDWKKICDRKINTCIYRN